MFQIVRKIGMDNFQRKTRERLELSTYNAEQHHQHLHLLPQQTMKAPKGKQPHNHLTSDYIRFNTQRLYQDQQQKANAIN